MKIFETNNAPKETEGPTPNTELPFEPKLVTPSLKREWSRKVPMSELTKCSYSPLSDSGKQKIMVKGDSV